MYAGAKGLFFALSRSRSLKRLASRYGMTPGGFARRFIAGEDTGQPDPPQGFELSSSNDVTIDDRGLCYLIDRQRGVDIIETSVL